MGRRKKSDTDPLEESAYNADDLLGFRSLYTPPPKEPGAVGTLLRLPFRLVALPFRLVLAVLRLPVRLLRRLFGGSGGTGADQAENA